MNNTEEFDSMRERGMREIAHREARSIFDKPVSDWDGEDYAFFSAARPNRLDEALTVALEMESEAGISAIAFAANMLGSHAIRPGEGQDLEAAHQYADVVARIKTGHTT